MPDSNNNQQQFSKHAMILTPSTVRIELESLYPNGPGFDMCNNSLAELNGPEHG
jgi:hypothetical protein